MVTRIQPAVSDQEAARSVSGLLSQLPDSEPVPPAADSTQLLDSLARLAEGTVADLPEVVLVHELIRPMPALELIREIALRFPAVGVILITRDTSQPLYSAAMDAGARGVLGLPLSYDDLAARVGAAASWAVGVRKHLGTLPEETVGPGGTVVAVTGAKGGVGTTLTAVQLALAAQASGRGTALVDMDLQSGDVSSFLDVQFRRSAADLAGIADISNRVLQDALFAHESGLGLLLAPGEGERGEEVDDRAARQIISALKARYDIVVIDCGTQLNAANAAAIETADNAVLLTTPDVISVRAAKRMVRMWDRLQIRKAEETLTLVNRTSRFTEIHPGLIARIVGTSVAGTTIPAGYKELHGAVDAGRIQDLDAKSSVKQALWSFAAELGLVTAAEAGSSGGGKHSAKAVKGHGGQSKQPLSDSASEPESRALPPGGPGSSQVQAVQGNQGAEGRADQSGRAAPRPPATPPAPFPPPRTPQARQGGAPANGPQALPPGASGGNHVMPGEAPGAPAGNEYRDHRRPHEPNSAAPFHTRTRVGPVGPEIGHVPGGRPARQPVDDFDDEGETSVWGDKGSVTVEFAGMAPIVLAVLAVLWQCVLVGYTFSLAGNAADEAARAATAAALGGDPEGACESAATKNLPAEWRENSSVSCRLDGHLWKADVDLSAPVLFPGAGKLPFSISGTAGAAEEGK
ncbi:AAA family ATPase [Streptomyces sp. WMMB 322]|uniref:AAA family ATPase n=1 Tax=Streptomyces sp. WMMB 322 TaxID=1286821 RepID=UPI0006E12B42|nr:AAA family ATPase [Streptomyces sp. WMMB 322]SCK26465.1 Cellulose biosynthesis protein BcsQ [Streptomyces sp. WMMB 322]